MVVVAGVWAVVSTLTHHCFFPFAHWLMHLWHHEEGGKERESGKRREKKKKKKEKDRVIGWRGVVWVE